MGAASVVPTRIIDGAFPLLDKDDNDYIIVVKLKSSTTKMGDTLDF
jgi:hypothetical protein